MRSPKKKKRLTLSPSLERSRIQIFPKEGKLTERINVFPKLLTPKPVGIRGRNLEHEIFPHQNPLAPNAAKSASILHESPNLDSRTFGGKSQDLLLHSQAPVSVAVRPPDFAVVAEIHRRRASIDKKPVGDDRLTSRFIHRRLGLNRGLAEWTSLQKRAGEGNGTVWFGYILNRAWKGWWQSNSHCTFRWFRFLRPLYLRFCSHAPARLLDSGRSFSSKWVKKTMRTHEDI